MVTVKVKGRLQAVKEQPTCGWMSRYPATRAATAFRYMGHGTGWGEGVAVGGTSLWSLLKLKDGCWLSMSSLPVTGSVGTQQQTAPERSSQGGGAGLS